MLFLESMDTKESTIVTFSQQIKAQYTQLVIDENLSFSTLETLSKQLGAKLKERGWYVTTAESCTGGGVAAILTEIPGSSAWVERGYVTYSNQTKHELLGVKEQTLATFGAVSAQTAAEMAQGVVAHSHSQLGLSITGIAGPDGGSAEKPVGTVWFGWYDINGNNQTFCHCFKGNRHQVRQQSIATALIGCLLLID